MLWRQCVVLAAGAFKWGDTIKLISRLALSRRGQKCLLKPEKIFAAMGCLSYAGPSRRFQYEKCTGLSGFTRHKKEKKNVFHSSDLRQISRASNPNDLIPATTLCLQACKRMQVIGCQENGHEEIGNRKYALSKVVSLEQNHTLHVDKAKETASREAGAGPPHSSATVGATIYHLKALMEISYLSYVKGCNQRTEPLAPSSLLCLSFATL